MPGLAVSRTMRSLGPCLLALSVLVVSLPAAEAQSGPTATLSLTLDDPARALEPGLEAELELYTRYTVSQAIGEPDPGVVEAGNGARPTRITFTVVQLPSWATEASVEPSEVFVYPPLGVGGQVNAPMVMVRVNVSPDAPALQREVIMVEAVAEENGAIPEARGRSPDIKIRAAEVANANVTSLVESPYVLEGGGWTTVPFQVRNDGNKDTTFILNVTVRPEMSEVEFPKEIALAVDQAATIEVRIRMPWTEREAGSLTFEATPLMEDDEGPSSSATVDVVGESAMPVGAAVPLVALLVAFLASRRR